MMSRDFTVGMLLATVCLSAPADAQVSALSPECISGAVVLPMLGGKDDSPIIPAQVNGRDVAFYLSTGFGENYVHSSDQLWFRGGDSSPRRAQDGNIVFARPTTLDSVKLGDIELDDIPAQVLSGPPHHEIAGRPIIGVLGSYMFRGVALLIDAPHKQVGIFRWKPGQACETAPARLFTGTYASLPMDSRGAVSVTLNGHKTTMAFDPDLEESVIPTSDALQYGVKRADFAHDDRYLTRYVSNVVGFDHRFDDFQIGDGLNEPFNFLVQDRIVHPYIGENFFDSVIALFDYPHGRFMFQVTDARDSTPPLHLHFDRVKEPAASVSEKQGHIE